jgi:hypothetical protein
VWRWTLTPHQYKRPRADGSLLTIFRCQQHTQFGSKACGGVAISADALDCAVIQAIDEHLGRGDFLERAFAAWDRNAEEFNSKVRNIEEQIASVNKKIANAREYILNHGDRDPLAAGLAADARMAADDLPALEERLRAARQTASTARNNTALRDELRAWFNAWTVGFMELDRERQRLFLEGLGAEVKLWRAGERSPRARLTLAIPTSSTDVLPAPLDAAAHRAAYGADATVDDDGIFVDTDAGQEIAYYNRQLTPRVKGHKIDTAHPAGYAEPSADSAMADVVRASGKQPNTPIENSPSGLINTAAN